MVLTHAHADHALGLTALAGRIPIGEVWARVHPPRDGRVDRASSEHSPGRIGRGAAGGEVYHLGTLTLAVDGPFREYASSNDQSIVLTVTGPERSMLLAGDIETYAQADLGHLRADA